MKPYQSVLCLLLTALLVACQPIQPVAPAAQPPTAPTVAASPAGEQVVGEIIATIPVKRLGTPQEIGSVVAWLAGEDSGFTTGADFSCNGGLHMG